MLNFSRKMTSPPLLRFSAGFTLIELSIVMAIIGIMVASALGAYKVMIVKEYRDTTQERMKEIRAAMVKFQNSAANTNKRLPCPAPLHAPVGSATFGLEEVDVPNNFNCTTLPTLVDTLRVTNGDGVTPISPPNTLRVGAVPVRSLGLSAEHANDSWGRRFVYVVSENLADGSGAYDANNGAITLLDTNGAPMGPVPHRTPFVLFSTGKNGAGGVTTDGKNYPISCPAPGTPEGENCDLAAPNATFGARTYSESTNPATRFDDYVAHTLEDAGGTGGGAEWIDDLKDGISDKLTNVFLGVGAGGLDAGGVNVGSGNTGVGIDALNTNTTGGANTAMGVGALLTNKAKWENTALGYWAMRFAYNGTAGGITPYNTAVGAYALQGSVNGQSVNSGSSNTALGYAALQVNSYGSLNTATGAQAMYSNGGGSLNTATGAFALWSNTSGTSNTAVGTQALFTNTASNNTALGMQALYANTSGAENTAGGYAALYANTTGNANTAFGKSALQVNTTGNGNTAAGHSALISNTDGDGNAAFGYQALYANVSGDGNAALGMEALYANTGGKANTAAGYQVLHSNTTGGGNTAHGMRALYANTIGVENTAVGKSALLNNIGGQDCTFSPCAYFGYLNTAVGANAMQDNTYGSYNTALGYGALLSNVTKHESTALGYQAMYYADDATSGAITYNTAVGAYALYGSKTASLNTGTSNTAVGHSALVANTSGLNNTAVGAYGDVPFSDLSSTPASALFSNTTGYNNTAIGVSALATNADGSANTAVGAGALKLNVMANNNTALGFEAMYFADNSTSIAIPLPIGGNTAVGAYALRGSYATPSKNNGSHNTAVGNEALRDNSSGYNNVAVGFRAGAASPENTTGNYNTFIGATTGGATVSLSNATAIGYGAMAPASNTIQIGNDAASGGFMITDVWIGAHTGAGATVHMGSYVTPSDLRAKKDIADSDLGLDFLGKLRPVSYRFKEGNNSLRYGFIAQDVEKALEGRATGMVYREKDKKKSYSLNYDDLIAPIVKAVQEIAAKFDALQKTVTEMAARFNPLEKMVREQQAQIDLLTQTVEELRAEIKSLRMAGRY